MFLVFLDDACSFQRCFKLQVMFLEFIGIQFWFVTFHGAFLKEKCDTKKTATHVDNMLTFGVCVW